MSEVDSITNILTDMMDAELAGVGGDDELFIRLTSPEAPFESPVSVLSSMMSPKRGPTSQSHHRLSVITMEEHQFPEQRVNKRKQSHPHRAIKQLASLAEKIINGIVVVEPRMPWEEQHYHQPHHHHHPQPNDNRQNQYLTVNDGGSRREKSRSPSKKRGRDELRVVIHSPRSEGSRSPSPSLGDSHQQVPLANTGSPASNPNTKITVMIGKHIPEDLDPEKLAARLELYETIYRKRKTPGTLAMLGSNKMSGFAGTPLDISGAPGASLLTDIEFELCSFLRLQPLQYFQSRDTLLRNYREQGFYKKSAAQKMLHIDVNKTGRLYDFFVMMEWLPSEETAANFMASTPEPVDWEELLP